VRFAAQAARGRAGLQSVMTGVDAQLVLFAVLKAAHQPLPTGPCH
jgi:hypothetical protein